MKPENPKGKNGKKQKKSLLEIRSDRINRPIDSDRITRPSDSMRPSTGGPRGSYFPGAGVRDSEQSMASTTSSQVSGHPNPMPLGTKRLNQATVPREKSIDEPLIAHMTLRGALSTAIDSGLEKDIVLSSKRNIFSGNAFGWGVFGSLRKNDRVLSAQQESMLPIHEANKRARTIKLNGVQYVDQKKSRTKFALPILALLIVSAIVATAVGVSLSGSSEEFTCGSSSEDARVRGLIAQNFDVSLGVAGVTNTLLTCLPSNAFAELSDSQQIELEDSNTNEISFTQTGLTSINEDAFSGPDLSGIVTLDLKQNGLSSIPDGTFKFYLESLVTIDLSNNGFVLLENDLFGNLPALKSLIFDSNPLTIFPEAIRGDSGITDLSFSSCGSLVGIAEDYFLGSYSELSRIVVSNTPLFDQFGSEEDFREFAGLLDSEREVTIIS